MKRDQFEQTVQRFELYSKHNPGLYRFGALLLALLGYASILLILLLLLTMAGGSVGLVIATHGNVAVLKLTIVCLIAAFGVGKALWVHIPPPEGRELKASEAPELFRVIKDVRNEGKAPPIHRVFLNREFNASLQQYALLGALGWYRNYLHLGLPLLLALDENQFRAVLAHEIGHLSGAHSKLGAWTYRLRTTWGSLLEAFGRKRRGLGSLFLPFFRWYFDFFNAYTFVLSRQQEVEADRFAARLTGAKTLASALSALEVQGTFLDSRYWAVFSKKNRETAEPTASPFAGMGPALHTGTDSQEETRWLQRALLPRTNFFNTHPSFADRLALLGQSPSLPPKAQNSAAEVFLGSLLGPLTAQWDEEWRKGIADFWKSEYEKFKEQSRRLEELEKKAETAPLEGDEAFERADLVEDVRGPEEAIPLLKAILEGTPEHASALYALGRIYLVQGKLEGLPLLEKVMAKDRNTLVRGSEMIAQFFESRGEPDKARPYWNRAESRGEALEKAHEEKLYLTPKDKFLHHGLPPAQLEALVNQLKSEKDLKAVYLVRKEIRVEEDHQSSLVLGLVPHRPWYLPHSRDADSKLQKRIAKAVALPGSGVVIALGSSQAALRKRIKKVPDAEIYRRK
jgi:Zn-dependent protease with chaperone function